MRNFDSNDPDVHELDEAFGPWRLVLVLDIDGKVVLMPVCDVETDEPLEAGTLQEARDGAAALLADGVFPLEPGELVGVNVPGGLKFGGVSPGHYRATLSAQGENPDTGKPVVITLLDRPTSTSLN